MAPATFVPPALVTNAEAVRITGLTRGQLRHRVLAGRLRIWQPFPRCRWRYFAEEIAALAEQNRQVR
jgi:hypothetical protein